VLEISDIIYQQLTHLVAQNPNISKKTRAMLAIPCLELSGGVEKFCESIATSKSITMDHNETPLIICVANADLSWGFLVQKWTEEEVIPDISKPAVWALMNECISNGNSKLLLTVLSYRFTLKQLRELLAAAEIRNTRNYTPAVGILVGREGRDTYCGVCVPLLMPIKTVVTYDNNGTLLQ
jgi:hypothetical protein